LNTFKSLRNTEKTIFLEFLIIYGLITISLNCPATEVTPPPVPVAAKFPESLLFPFAVIMTLPDVAEKLVVSAPVLL